MRRFVRVTVIFASAVFGSVTARAQAPTLKLIQIEDGASQTAYNDWAEVLANPANTSVDGDGTTPALCGPINPNPDDLDCRVAPIGQVGRDLMRFSWTYTWNGDPATSFVALYVERFEETSNGLDFFFIADIDGAPEAVNGIPYLDPGDKVIQATYKGGNGLTLGAQGPKICNYVPSQGALCTSADPDAARDCDPIADPATGKVDGYKVLGSIGSTCTAVPQCCPGFGPASCTLAEQCDSGDRDATSLFYGKRFEIRAPWSTFGATAASGPLPLFWHVAVANGGLGLAGALDNIGGRNDTLGTFSYETVDVTPALQIGGAASPGSSSYGFVLTSNGTAPALANLAMSSSLRLPTRLYADTTLDGKLTPGTLTLMATDGNGDGSFETIAPGFDADGDSRPDPGVRLAPGATFEVASVQTVGSGLDQLVDRSTLTVVAIDSTATAAAETAIGFVVFTPGAPVRSGQPGAAVPVPVRVTNYSGGAAIINISTVDIAGDNGPYATALYADTDCDGGADGPLVDSPVDADPTPDVGSLANGDGACLVVGVTVPGGAAVGNRDRLYVRGSVATDGNKVGNATVTIDVRNRVTVVPGAYGSDSNPVSLSSAEIRYFPYTLINSGSAASAFEVCVDWSPAADAPYFVRLFSDPDGDGDISDGQELLVFSQSSDRCGGATEELATLSAIAPFGGTLGLVMEVRVPLSPAILSGPTLHHFFRVDDRGVANDLARGEVISNLGKLSLYADAGLNGAATYFTSCDTIYFQARRLSSVSQDLYYRLAVYRPGPILDACLPNPASCADHYITDLFGEFTGSYTLAAGKPTGAWQLRLIDDNTPSDENYTVNTVVERAGSLSAVLPTQADFVHFAADDVSFSVNVTNDNVGAPFTTSTLYYAILDDTLPTPQYWTGSGWAPFSAVPATVTGSVAVPALGAGGASTTVGVNVANVGFPDEDPPATYTIRVWWGLLCGDLIAGPQDAAVNVWGCASDTDLDGCTNCLDSLWNTFSPDADSDSYGSDCDCDDADAAIGANATWYKDIDNDGYSDGASLAQCGQPLGYRPASALVSTSGDCDDLDAAVHPATIWYKDLDLDGYSDGTSLTQCLEPPGYVLATALVGTSGDCDDLDATLSPATTWFKDLDGDAYADGASLTQCLKPAGYELATALLATSGDCDDTPISGFSTYPGATEVIADGVDQNCDSVEACYQDLDDDGYGSTIVVDDTDLICANGSALTADVSTDCDDANAAVNPATLWYQDADGDGYANGTAVTQCAPPLGYALATALVNTSGDCDDGDAALNPATVWYRDVDADGYSDGAALTQCAPPVGYALATALVDTSGDCDDGDATLNPATVWYADLDADLVSSGATFSQCSQPAGYARSTSLTALSGDCLDTNAAVHLNATEVCDGFDTDCSSGGAPADDPAETDPDGDRFVVCSGFVNHGGGFVGGDDCDNADPNSYPGAPELCDGYADDCSGVVPGSELDDDGDGFVGCAGWDDTYHPNALVIDGGDCNDLSPSVNPGLAEVTCNGVDDDCDFLTLDEPGGADADSDGYTVLCGQDCDDTNFFVHPGGVENCTDALDNDCDGSIDSADPACASTCVDADGDGYRSVACGGSDCDDSNPFINAGAAESCTDGIDNNCNARVDGNDPLCPASCPDADGDGYPRATCGGSDCDDGRAGVHPGQPELCTDGQDNNCDGRVDAADPLCPADCADWDGDGYPDRDCGGSDCNDRVASIHPGGGESCLDGVDNDCNGLVDANDPRCPAGCADADGDGYESRGCDGSDCDDSRGTINPGRREDCTDGVDNDCSGLADGDDPQCPAGCPDDDGDGYRSLACGGSDCDDAAFFVNPAIGERCVNGIDDNCDGRIDYQDPGECPAGCADGDGDGYLAATCGGRDCDDGDPAVSPGAVEDCTDNADNNCDGVVDGRDPGACPPACIDQDGDGYPDLACGGSDCNDLEAATHPGAVEVACDALDDDCNVLTADLPDLDRDGFTSSACPPGTDCDDGNPLVNPTAGEHCGDGLDNDCNGQLDAADPLCPAGCVDADGDDYASAGCDGSDCDDGNPNRHPGAAEQCNDGVDNDCDGAADGADVGDCPPGCVDFDRDGYPSGACGGSDCDDWRFDVHPGAGEHCGDGVDDDCNGLVDGADVASCPAGCVDADLDGYESAVCGGTDCDDAQVSVNPGAGEACSGGIDDNCDGRIDAADPLCPSGCVDTDQDGYDSAACGGSDCDDSEPRVHPGAVEGCSDGGDDDCNGLVDDLDPACPAGCADGDGDGYRSGACGGQDCDDSSRAVFPDAGERCNDGVDNDCNGLKDGADPECPAGCADVDGDGYEDAGCGGADCNDADASIRPGAAESCGDGVDNDCDLLQDGADSIDCPPACVANDDDDDGYPDVVCGGSDCDDSRAIVNPGRLEAACNGTDDDCNAVTADDSDPADADGDGHTRGCGHDCDDSNPLVHRGGVERCDDGLDNDCNGLVDAADGGGCPAGCADADVDGYPDVACGGSDCDDGDFTVNRGAGESCTDGADNDCNGRTDLDDPACSVSCTDLDGDGYQSATCGGFDCDDTAASTHPGGGESCADGVDNDCNGLVDAVDLGSCPPGCVDADGDGYTSTACGGSDCNDAATSANPGRFEVCDGLDNNCNGGVDDGFIDADRDGVADCVDVDTDGDGCADLMDANPTGASADQDGDGFAVDCDCEDDDDTIHVDCDQNVWGVAGGCNCAASGSGAGLALVAVFLGARHRRRR
ncbi:MAG: putative metal-binding motif-containing protein [Deltaproteobacteria bacterium]|nr:putative metal-binding motif-containing protein [Deltaproteobacteria bacterium]